MELGSILNVIDYMRYNITKLIKSITLLNNNKFSQILTWKIRPKIENVFQKTSAILLHELIKLSIVNLERKTLVDLPIGFKQTVD